MLGFLPLPPGPHNLARGCETSPLRPWVLFPVTRDALLSWSLLALSGLRGLAGASRGFARRHRQALRVGFTWEGDRGALGSAALKRVGLCLPPEGLHGVRYSTGDTTALSWGPSVWKGQSLCSKGPGGFWPWS